MTVQTSIRYTVLLITFSLLSACISDFSTANRWPKTERTQAHIELGMDYLQRGNLKVARERFEKALDIDARSSAAYHGLGLVEAKGLNLLASRTHLARSVDLDPQNIRAVSDYAVILCELGEVDLAIGVLENTKIPVSAPTLSLYLALGKCYEAKNILKQAEAAYLEVLTQNPSIRQALLSMGRIRYKLSEYLSARAFMQRYFSTNTISSEALLLAAKVEDKLDNIAGRESYIRQLRKRYPKSEQTTQARKIFSR